MCENFHVYVIFYVTYINYLVPTVHEGGNHE